MIHIGIDPVIFQLGAFLLTWHGFFSFIAVMVAVILVTRWARSEGMVGDTVYATAIWAILGGIIGARAVHVIDRWDLYGNNPTEILAIWQGGIALLGAILGGLIAGSIYAYINKYQIGKLADLTAPALLIAQSIGRVGDIINGEHVSKVTNFSWGFVYTHPDSLSNRIYGLQSTHPSVGYEIVWNMLVLGIVYLMRDRIKPDGMLFVLYLALYSFGRFFITFLREDRVWIAGLQQAHLITIIFMAVTIPVLVYKARIVNRD